MNFEPFARRFERSLKISSRTSFQAESIPRSLSSSQGPLPATTSTSRKPLPGFWMASNGLQSSNNRWWLQSGQRLARCSKVPILDADSPSEFRGLHSKVAYLFRAAWRDPKVGPPTAVSNYHIWSGQPVIGFMAESDFEDRTVVEFANFNPMWSFSTQMWTQTTSWEHYLWNGSISHQEESTDSKGCSDLSKSDCRLQGSYSSPKSWNHSQSSPSSILWCGRREKGSNILSNDMELCLSVWHSSHLQWSTLREGAAALLSHECVLAVIAQMSNKSQRHPQCAFAHAPSCVLSGMMVSLTPALKLLPQIPRPVKLSEPVEFDTIDNMRAILKSILSSAADFVEVPQPCRVSNLDIWFQGQEGQQAVCSLSRARLWEPCLLLRPKQVHDRDLSNSMRPSNGRRELSSSMSGTTRSTRRTNGHGNQRMIERVGTREARNVLQAS